MSTFAVLLAVLLHLGDSLTANRGSMAVLQALMTLVSVSSGAFTFAFLSVISSTNFHALGVQDKVAVLIFLCLSFEMIDSVFNSFDLRGSDWSGVL